MSNRDALTRRAVDLFNDGLTFGQIAIRLNVSRSVIAGIISRARSKNKTVKGGGRRLSDTDLLMALKMRDAGNTALEIAGMLRCTTARIEAELLECDQGQ